MGRDGLGQGSTCDRRVVSLRGESVASRRCSLTYASSPAGGSGNHVRTRSLGGAERLASSAVPGRGRIAVSTSVSAPAIELAGRRGLFVACAPVIVDGRRAGHVVLVGRPPVFAMTGPS